MNEYEYVDTAGALKKVSASSANDAMRLAPGIAKNSGVSLVTAPKTTPAAPVPASSLTPGTTPTLPSPTAPQVQQEYVTSLTENVDKKRATLDKTFANQKAEADRELAKLEKEQEKILGKADTLTDPFREKLENTERERLYVNKNFEANQKLTDELDTLLTEGNNLIKYNQGLPVSQRVLNVRVDNAIRDVAARAGVIEAVMAARNSQIGQANNLIDRSVAAITADRKDKLSYYDTLLSLNNSKVLTLSAESKRIATEQVNLMKGDLERAEKTADYIKSLMISPEHAQLVADAGITLSDSVTEINAKLAKATKQQEIVDTTNELVAKGYTPVLAPGAGIITLELGGQKVYFREPPVKTTGGGSGGVGGSVGTPMSLNQIDQFRRSYGWSPPFGYSMGQLTQFMADNPGLSPEEYEALANQAATAEGGAGGIEDLPARNTIEGMQARVKRAVDMGFAREEIEQAIRDEYTQAELHAIAKAGQHASFWTPKGADITRMFDALFTM